MNPETDSDSDSHESDYRSRFVFVYYMLPELAELLHDCTFIKIVIFLGGINLSASNQGYTTLGQ